MRDREQGRKPLETDFTVAEVIVVSKESKVNYVLTFKEFPGVSAKVALYYKDNGPAIDGGQDDGTSIIIQVGKDSSPIVLFARRKSGFDAPVSNKNQEYAKNIAIQIEKYADRQWSTLASPEGQSAFQQFLTTISPHHR
jgi:hypothetical protein